VSILLQAISPTNGMTSSRSRVPQALVEKDGLCRGGRGRTVKSDVPLEYVAKSARLTSEDVEAVGE